MSFISDIFKTDTGRWKAESMWAWVALIIFHSSAAVAAYNGNLTLREYAISVGILHALLFATNGLNRFFDKFIPGNVNISTNNTTVTTDTHVSSS